MKPSEQVQLEILKTMGGLWSFASKGTQVTTKEDRLVFKVSFYPNKVPSGSDRSTLEASTFSIVEEMCNALESHGEKIDLFSRSILEAGVTTIFDRNKYPQNNLHVELVFSWIPDGKINRVCVKTIVAFDSARTTYPTYWLTDD